MLTQFDWIFPGHQLPFKFPPLKLPISQLLCLRLRLEANKATVLRVTRCSRDTHSQVCLSFPMPFRFWNWCLPWLLGSFLLCYLPIIILYSIPYSILSYNWSGTLEFIRFLKSGHVFHCRKKAMQSPFMSIEDSNNHWWANWSTHLVSLIQLLRFGQNPAIERSS